MKNENLSEWESVTRRKALAALGTAGVAMMAGVTWTREAGQHSSPGDGGGAGDGDGELTPEPEPTPTSSPTPDPMVTYFEDHGGVADGRTDDTEALLAALDAAAPGGTVVLPAGDIVIGAEREVAIRIPSETQGVQIQGAGPAITRLRMAPGHDSVHRGILIEQPEVSDSRIAIRDLTLDGRGLDQEFNIANGIEVDSGDGSGVNLEIRNCVIRDWATNGIRLQEPGARIYNSAIVQNGRKQEQMTGRDGHGIAAPIGDNPEGLVLIEGCLMRGNTGGGADNNGGNMTVRNCVIDSCGYGIKQNRTTNMQVIENTLITNLQTEPGIYNIPSDKVGGHLVMNNVVIDGGTDPGILFPAGGRISGDRIVIRGTNTEQSQPAQFVVRDEGRTFDIDRLAVLGTSGGTDVYFENCTGSIARLIHDGSRGSIGPLSDVSVSTIGTDLFGVTVPQTSDVGVPVWPPFSSLRSPYGR